MDFADSQVGQQPELVIVATDLVKRYAGVTALKSVGFTVRRGEVFGLVGPNGAGKTTLLRLLTDILRPDEGYLSVLGTTRLRDTLSRIGYMPEERGLYKQSTALETVSYFARLKGLSAAAASRAAEEALVAAGMESHARRKVEELSKGMAQRVQFAATVAHNPELLILDEPFSGLDPVSTLTLQELVMARRTAGATVLLSTHNMAHAEKLCDRLLMLHRGAVTLYGTLNEIRAPFLDNAILAEFEGPALTQCSNAEVHPLGSHRVRIVPHSGVTRKQLLAMLLAADRNLVRFEPIEPTLEDIFIKSAGAEAAQAVQATHQQQADD